MYLDFIKHQVEPADLENITFILAAEGKINLPEAGLDLAFSRNVFHHLSEPGNFFVKLMGHLEPSGKVAIIERKRATVLSLSLVIIRLLERSFGRWKRLVTSQWHLSTSCLIRPLLCLQ
jgi:Methyltransferase domain